MIEAVKEVEGRSGLRQAVVSRTEPRGVVVAGPLPPPIGGIAAFVDSMRGHPFGPDVNLTFVNAAKAVGSRENPWTRSLEALRSLSRVSAKLLATDAEVLHIHTSSYAAFIEKSVLVWVAKALGRRSILHIHGAEFDLFYARADALTRRYVRRVLGTADRVVALSARWAGYLVTEVGVPAERVIVVPNGVHSPGRPQRNFAPNRPLNVLLLAVIDERKGIHEFLAAARILTQAGVDLRFSVAGPIAGGQTARRSLEQLAESFGIGDRVEWLGPVTGEKKWECFRKADIFTIPSHAEGLPIALLEAMAMGLPTVATPVGAIPEVLTDEQHTLFVPVRDETALAGALKRLALDAELRKRLGTSALERFEAHYRFEAVGARLEELYLSL